MKARILKLFALALLASTIGAQAQSNAPGPDPTGIVLKIPVGARPVDAATRHCLPIKQVEVRGVVLVDETVLEPRIAALVSQCVTEANARAILSAINEFYAERGYVTTQGYLPEQDIRATKTLIINIIAGRIDKVVYKENRGDEPLPFGERMERGWTKVRGSAGPWDLAGQISQFLDRLDDPIDDFQVLPRDLTTNAKLWTSFVASSGDVVQIDTLQQGVDQINRVASSHSQIKLAAGATPATSIVSIENEHSDSFRVFIGYEVNGTQINGSGQTVPNRLRLDVAKDNLVGINDAWRTSFASGQNSNEVRAAFSMPLRSFTLSVDAGYSENSSAIASGLELFTRDGNVTTALGYQLRRSRDVQTNIDTSIAWRTGERFLNGSPLTPQTISYGRTGISELRSFETVQLSYGVGLNHGLQAFNANRDAAAITKDTPRAQFFKVDSNASVLKSFPDVGMLRFDVNAQWTADPLYSDDQLVLGSIGTVRGFTSSTSRVDQGAVFRSEFAPAIPVDLIMGSARDSLVMLHEVLKSLQPYVFADAGRGYDIANDLVRTRAAVGAGVRYRHGRINLDASIAEPVYRHGGVKPRSWQSTEAYLTLSVKLF